jgi:hypothetical protein
VRFQVLTAPSMKFRIVFWDVLPCKIIVDMMMEVARTSETSVDNYFTRQYIPEDNQSHGPLRTATKQKQQVGAMSLQALTN